MILLNKNSPNVNIYHSGFIHTYIFFEFLNFIYFFIQQVLISYLFTHTHTFIFLNHFGIEDVMSLYP